MPDRCAFFSCSNRGNSAEGISLHCIPFYSNERLEAKPRRKITVNFVARKRAQWTPSKYSTVCSVHFTDADYEKYIVEIPGMKNYTPSLKRDDFGITTYPTIFLQDNEPKNPTPRGKRWVCKKIPSANEMLPSANEKLFANDMHVATICCFFNVSFCI